MTLQPLARALSIALVLGAASPAAAFKSSDVTSVGQVDGWSIQKGLGACSVATFIEGTAYMLFAKQSDKTAKKLSIRVARPAGPVGPMDMSGELWIDDRPVTTGLFQSFDAGGRMTAITFDVARDSVSGLSGPGQNLRFEVKTNHGPFASATVTVPASAWGRWMACLASK